MISKQILALLLLITAFMFPAMGQTSASDWVDKSLVLYNQGRYNEAIQACDKAIELDPKYAMPWNNKGGALFFLGRYDDAIQAYDKATKLDPKDATAGVPKLTLS
jgi:tetratricopeptide (TPR) repeat protein